MNPAARKLIDDFAGKSFPGAFPFLDRAKVAYGLSERVADPSKINQGQSGLCPSAAVVYDLALTRPVDYVKAVTELFDRGNTTIGKWTLKPCNDLKIHKLPSSAGVPQVDWIIMASIRDSENWFIDFQSETDNGGAWGHEIARWLRKAGYTDVKEDWNSTLNKTAANLETADLLYSKDYQVCLLIDSDLLQGETAFVSQPNHWVVLASDVQTTFALPTSEVTMRVFTYGARKTLPKSAMELDDFVDYYYGYVAAKF